MRILYASFDEVPSYKGASTHILASARRAVRAHELHLVTLGSTRLPSLDGLRHHPQILDEPNYLRRGLAFRARVAALAETVRPDVAHFRSPWEGLALLDRGLPCLYEVNGLASLELRQLYSDVPGRALDVLRGWELRCLGEARAIVCPSTRIRDHLLELTDGAIAHKISVVPNGHDLVPMQDTRTNGPLRLVYLGTLHPWQGMFRVLRLFRALRGLCTVDVFAPPHRSWSTLFGRRILRHGLGDIVRVHPPLHRLALHARLPTYDCGIAPLRKTERNTVQGCHPVKLLDYLSHGLPVVAPDLFVVRQTVGHEHNGLLYEPDDAAAFVAAITRLAGDRALLQRLRAETHASLASLPTWDEHSERILTLYESLSAGAPRRPLALELR